MSCTSKELALEHAAEAFRFFRDQIEARRKHEDYVVQFVLEHFKIGNNRSEEAVLNHVKLRAR